MERQMMKSTRINVDVNEAWGSLLLREIGESIRELFLTAHKKYELKASIIGEDDNMTTEEKRIALDQDYCQYHKEISRIVLEIGSVLIAGYGLSSVGCIKVRSLC